MDQNRCLYDGTFDEIYALNAMCLAFGRCYLDFEKCEHPDWCNPRIGVGLEVTRAQTAHIGYTYHFSNQYLGKRKNEVPEHDLKIFSGHIFTSQGRIIGISDSKGSVDGTRHVKLAVSAYEKKLCRLNSTHFTIFNENELFMYLTFMMNSDDMDLFRVECSKIEDNHAVKFSRIMLFDNCALYSYRPSSGLTESYNFSDEELSRLLDQSLVLRSKSKWKNGTKFCEVLRQV